MDLHIDKVLIDRNTIAQRVKKLAEQINSDFTNIINSEFHTNNTTPPPLIIIPIMTGSIVFLADLMRQLPIFMRIRIISASSYTGNSTTNQNIKLNTPLPDDLENAHILLLDDILDSGQTLTVIRQLLEQQQPATIKTCVLLRKRIPSAMAVHADYVGFDIDDNFVIGYGLDYNDFYRNLPDIAILKPEAMH